MSRRQSRTSFTVRLAYGHDSMAGETRDALLCSQLQEGLKYSLMESPAVSGATSYQSVCVAAKSEEWRQAALKKRKQYRSDPAPSYRPPSKWSSKPVGEYKLRTGESWTPARTTDQRYPNAGSWTPRMEVRCWKCRESGPSLTTQGSNESLGWARGKPATANVVKATERASPGEWENPLDYLFSNSDSADVKQIQVLDQGSVHAPASPSKHCWSGVVDIRHYHGR